MGATALWGSGRCAVCPGSLGTHGKGNIHACVHGCAVTQPGDPGLVWDGLSMNACGWASAACAPGAVGTAWGVAAGPQLPHTGSVRQHTFDACQSSSCCCAGFTPAPAQVMHSARCGPAYLGAVVPGVAEPAAPVAEVGRDDKQVGGVCQVGGQQLPVAGLTAGHAGVRP